MYICGDLTTSWSDTRWVSFGLSEDITKNFCAITTLGLFEIPQLILQIKHMWTNDDRLH